MNKNFGMLCVIGAVIAIATAIAVARRALPLLPAFNPLADWPTWRIVVAFVIALTASIASVGLIVWSDAGLPWPSATLEWVYSSAKAKEIVADYGERRGDAVRGVAIDTLAFIPSYVLLIAISACSVARGWSSPHLAAWTVAAGWSAVLAGALDYLENSGILAALGGVTTRVAPLTYAACQLKWIVVVTAVDFVLIALVLRLAGR